MDQVSVRRGCPGVVQIGIGPRLVVSSNALVLTADCSLLYRNKGIEMSAVETSLWNKRIKPGAKVSTLHECRLPIVKYKDLI